MYAISNGYFKVSKLASFIENLPYIQPWHGESEDS